MDVKARSQPGKIAPWKMAVCVAIGLFGGFQLYEWYDTGQIYARKFGTQHYVSYTEHPGLFTFAAVIYVLGVLLFLVGPLIMLINNIRRRR
jgi:hypothetical protein